jgi:acyl carrier protein
MDQEAFRSAVNGFLAELVGDREEPGGAVPVGDDDDLYKIGLVDSVDLIRLLNFVEELAGKEIELEEHDFDSLHTIRGLYRAAHG